MAPRAGMGQPAPGGEAGSTRCRDTWALPALGLCSEGSEEGPCPTTWRPQVRLLEAEAPDLLPVCANPGRTHHPHLHEASLCDVKRSTQKLRKPGRESPPFPPPSVTPDPPPGTLVSLTNGRRIWKNFFTGQGQLMAGHKHAAQWRFFVQWKFRGRNKCQILFNSSLHLIPECSCVHSSR